MERFDYPVDKCSLRMILVWFDEISFALILCSPFGYRAIITTGCTFCGNSTFTFVLIDCLEHKLQHPSKVVKYIRPSLHFIFTLIAQPNTPPSQCQKEHKKPVWASFPYLVPVREYSIVGRITGKCCDINTVFSIRPSINTPLRLKADVPRLPVGTELPDIPCHIRHVSEVTMSFEPLVDCLWPVLATKSVFLSLLLQIQVSYSVKDICQSTYLAFGIPKHILQL